MFEFTHLVTLNVTPNWQPTSKKTEKTAEFWCGIASYCVEWTTHDGKTERHYGEWSEYEAAHRFAVSMPSQTKARAVACDQYLYAPAYGKIENEAVRLANPEDRR